MRQNSKKQRNELLTDMKNICDLAKNLGKFVVIKKKQIKLFILMWFYLTKTRFI